MMPQDFESWQGVAAAVDATAASRPIMAAYAMRPLTTGEVLDRTFSIYRSRFWLFAGISAVSGAVQLAANGISLTGQQFVMTRYGFATATMESMTGSMIGAVLFLMAAAITQAATVYALSEVYTGRPVTVVASLKCAAVMWYRYIGIAAWQLWSALWLMLVLVTPGVVLLIPRFGFRSIAWLGALLVFVGMVCGGVYGVIAYLRNSLAIPASVVEHSRVRPSMRRSKTLSAGAKGRIFVVLLIAAVLFWVGGAIQAPMAFFIMRAPMQSHTVARAALLLVNFATHTLVSPVALIGLSLVYFDQRVRLEGLDLWLMLGGDVATAGAAPSTNVRSNGTDALS